MLVTDVLKKFHSNFAPLFNLKSLNLLLYKNNYSLNMSYVLVSTGSSGAGYNVRLLGMSISFWDFNFGD